MRSGVGVASLKNAVQSRSKIYTLGTENRASSSFLYQPSDPQYLQAHAHGQDYGTDYLAVAADIEAGFL